MHASMVACSHACSYTCMHARFCARILTNRLACLYAREYACILVCMTASRRARVLAVALQKGGVGKSTSSVNLSAAFAQQGLRVLLIDLDQQANATDGLGIEVGPDDG